MVPAHRANYYHGDQLGRDDHAPHEPTNTATNAMVSSSSTATTATSTSDKLGHKGLSVSAGNSLD
jgi:hypothetical protein